MLYQVPRWIYPSDRRALQTQNFPAQIEPNQLLFPTEQEIPTVQAFGIPDEDRHNPAAILTLIPAVQRLIDFAFATSDPDLSSMVLRQGMRHVAIIALGARANLHVEAAGAMREQGYEQRLIDEQLAYAYRVMTFQLEQLRLVLFDGEDVAAIMQVIIEDREALGYTPQIPPRRRFWEGVRGFFDRGSL